MTSEREGLFPKVGHDGHQLPRSFLFFEGDSVRKIERSHCSTVAYFFKNTSSLSEIFVSIAT